MRKIITIAMCLAIAITALNSQVFDGNDKEILKKDKFPHPKPIMRMIDFEYQRAYPNSKIPMNARENALKQVKELEYKFSKSDAYLQAQQPEWKPVGPFNVGGRIKSIVTHPTDSKIVYAAAAAGGIWKTTTSGGTWFPIFDFESSIAFGQLAIDPKNPDVLYAGTGEAVIGAGQTYLGTGLYKTTDAGNSWRLLGMTDAGSFSKLFVSKNNSNLIYASTIIGNEGLWKSINGGESFTEIFDGTVTDFVVNPVNDDEVFIAENANAIKYTNDGGLNWVSRFNGIFEIRGRISISASSQDFNILYCLIEGGPSREGRIYKTTDKGNYWNILFTGGGGFFNGQGMYNNCIAVDPKNHNNVLAGGIEMWLSNNGGKTWGTVNNSSSNGYMHVDQHCITFSDAKANTVYVGNDGGIYVSNNNGLGWAPLNNNLQVTQFYAMAIDNSVKNKNYGGTQDNGTVGMVPADNWNMIYGGDGFDVVVNPKNPRIVWGELYYGRVWKFELQDNGSGNSQLLLHESVDQDTGIWHSPLVWDKRNEILWLGKRGLHASSGTYFSQVLAKQTYRFTAIGLNQNEGDIIYAGNEAGQVFLSTDYGDKWNQIQENGLINRFVKDIKVSNFDPNVAYICYSGYGTPHIFKTTNLGQSWTNISLNLPDSPVNDLEEHPDDPNILFIATDVGVFATYDGGNVWFPYGVNLPNSPVIDLELHTNRNILPDLTMRAATHGRSIWEVVVNSIAPDQASIVSPVGGELYIGRNSYRVAWYGFPEPVKVEYSSNNGAEWNTIASSAISNSLLWAVPNINAEFCLIKITSVNEPSISKISNIFSINKVKKGDVLKITGVNFVPYGIVHDGENSLWTTSFYSNKLSKINLTDFTVEQQYNLPAGTLYTDLTYDKQNGVFYIHRMNDSNGIGGVILKVDKTGNLISQYPSPAKNYPIGICYVDGTLYAAERDGGQRIYALDPATGKYSKEFDNPFKINYGPRGLGYDGEYIYQASTAFPNGTLEGGYIVKLNKNNPAIEIDRMPLFEGQMVINCRGIDADPIDKNFWVSSFSGSIYKIAGFNAGIVSVDDNLEFSNKIETNIYPNPAFTLTNISFKMNQISGWVDIDIYDMYGRKILNIYHQYLNNDGFDVINYNTDNISAGMYNIIFTINGNKELTKKLIITK